MYTTSLTETLKRVILTESPSSKYDHSLTLGAGDRSHSKDMAIRLAYVCPVHTQLFTT